MGAAACEAILVEQVKPLSYPMESRLTALRIEKPQRDALRLLTSFTSPQRKQGC
jgi:hypothetical protein